MFKNKYYKEVDGVAMGSPLGPALANFLSVVFKVNGFQIVLMISNLYSIDVISMTYLNCFLLVIIQIIKEYLSSKHPNINFHIEKEKDGCLPFLEVIIFRENEKFTTNVFRKKWGVYQLQKALYLKHIKLV